jgi:hypothetical protein
MKTARPFPQGMETHGFGLGALVVAFLVPACLWMVAEAASVAAKPRDARKVEFTHAAAGVQARLQLLRGLERSALASSANAAKSGYYRQRRDAVRQQVDELARGAASIAAGAEERARLAALDRLARAADTRYARVLAATGTQITPVMVVQR